MDTQCDPELILHPLKNGELTAMKGPGMRADLDVRRVWQCPRCGKSKMAAGDVASVTCKCQPEGTFMRLQEPRRQVKTFPYPVEEPAGSEIVPEGVIEDAATDVGEISGDVPGGNTEAPSGP